MDADLVDRIYESSFVPELWPGVLDELGRIAEGPGGALFIANAEFQYWTASPGSFERTGKMVNEGWFLRGQFAARTFAARHAGFLNDIDYFTPDEKNLEPLYRDFWRPQGISWCVGTVIPIPTGENVTFALTRRPERGPFERAVVQKLASMLLTYRDSKASGSLASAATTVDAGAPEIICPSCRHRWKLTEEVREAILMDLRSWDRRFDRPETLASQILEILSEAVE